MVFDGSALNQGQGYVGATVVASDFSWRVLPDLLGEFVQGLWGVASRFWPVVGLKPMSQKAEYR